MQIRITLVLLLPLAEAGLDAADPLLGGGRQGRGVYAAVFPGNHRLIASAASRAGGRAASILPLHTFMNVCIKPSAISPRPGAGARGAAGELPQVNPLFFL